ncbi:beta strand repeat-containing protein [Cerasicoccus frondis]|uniref:beta strand repeat-containing protein n=1 Tax=Cerasicoccus frondis TaxID=490090 RepID=UPI00285252FA|nr:autotransporter-associated beta strand repeat-containing protein [Cerasicoccus frondis]
MTHGDLPKLIRLAILASNPLSLGAQLVYNESFRYESAPGWEFQTDGSGSSPGARLTATATPNAADPESGAPSIDVNGNGWLRLATTTGNQANAVALDTAIPSSSNTIRVKFDFAFWKPGTNPADGITVFMWDASESFDPGAYGGSLGYAQRTGVDGLAGAYVGVGLDVYGNFANGEEGRSGDITGLVPNTVTVRGEGSGTTGYDFLTGTVSNTTGAATSTLFTNLDFANSANRPDQDAADYRHFVMELDENDQLTVWMQSGFDNSLTQILQTTLPGVRPDELRLGFSGATGGFNEVYEIRNLEISTFGGDNSYYWDNEAGDSLWGTSINWDQDTVPTTYSHVLFTDAFADTLTDQSITLDGGDKTISSATFAGGSSYELTPSGSQSLIFDTNGVGKSYLNVLNSPTGNADHTIHTDIVANNELDIQNLVAQTLTLTGDINTNGNTVKFETAGVTTASGVISGAGAVVTDGEGETIFYGDNTYTGQTTIEDGRLRIEHSNALGATANGVTVENGGSLALANNISTPSGETLLLNGVGDGYTGALVNAGGANSFQGAITLQSHSTIGAESGTLDVDGAVAGSGYDLTAYTAAGTDIDFNGAISGSGTNLTKTGEGTATLSVGNTYSGDTTVSAGTLRIENNGALGDVVGETYVSSGATLEMANVGSINSGEEFYAAGTGVSGKAAIWADSGTNQINNTVTLSGGTTYIGAETGASLELNGSGGNLDGAGQNVVITGGGTVIYSGSEGTQSGTTEVLNGSTLQLNNSGGLLHDSSALVVDGTFNMGAATNNELVGSLAGSGSVLTQGATLTAGSDDTDTTFSGVISGSGDFVKQGDGNMAFSGANTFTGSLTVDDGTVTMGANHAFADSMNLVLEGGTFAVNGYADTMDFMVLNASSTIDFQGATGGYLTFADMDHDLGILTIDNWAGSFSGNGNTRLQVLDNELNTFGTGPGSLINIYFTGYGDADLISLGGGVYEIVPDLSGFYEWTAGNNGNPNDWNRNGNWDGPAGFPNSTAARAYIGTADANLDGRTIELNGSRVLNTLVIDNDAAFTIAENTLIFDTLLSAPLNLTVLGDSSPTFNSNLAFYDNALFTNNSTGVVTVNGNMNLGDLLIDSEIRFMGSGTTVINGNIVDSFNQGQVFVDATGDGTVEFHGNNTFSDGFILNSGNVLVGSNSALGNDWIAFNGGRVAATGADRSLNETYSINADLIFGNDDGSDLTLSGAGSLSTDVALTVESGVTTNLTGVVSGNQVLTKEGDGTLNLTAANTFDELVVNDGAASSLIGGNMLIGGAGTGTSVFGDGDVIVNSGGTLDATAGGSIEIGDSATLTNAGVVDVTAGGSLTFDGDFTQTAGSATFDIGGNILTDGASSVAVSGGTVDFIGDSNFTTSNAGSSISVTNGATMDIDLTNGATGSTLTISQNDTLTVDGSGSLLTVATDTNGSINLNGQIDLHNSGYLTVTQGPTIFGANSTFDGGNAATAGTLEVRDDLTFTSGMDIGNAPNITLNIADGDSTLITAATANTNIENLGTITKTGDGLVTIGSNLNNIQAGTILINGGTLLNATSNQIENNTAMVFGDNLTGSTTPTWNVNDSDEVLGTLTLDASSQVNLNLGSDAGDGSIVKFADSSEVAWNSSGSLIIEGWNGEFDGGGLDQVYIGADLYGATTAQVGQIFFKNPAGLSAGIYAARILPTGEVVPYPVPEPGTYAMGGALILCLALFEWRRQRKGSTSQAAK